MSGDKVRGLLIMLAGFAASYAIINAARGQHFAVMRPSVDMAVQSSPALFSQSQLMQPMRPMRSTQVSATPAVAPTGFSGLVPCAESKKFAKLLKTETGALDKRMKLYAKGSAPALALEETKARTAARFANYAKSGLLCGSDGLPHLIAEPGLALRYGHAGDTLIPTVGFLYIAGLIGESGRQYLGATQSKEKEIMIDVGTALSSIGKSVAWPSLVWKDFRAGKLINTEVKP